MAVNDAEIKIGVSLDADQFKNAYDNLLNNTSQKTQGFIQNALAPENMKGAATKTWDMLPYSGMHEPTGGNILATQAFMSSFAEDMRASGIRKGSLGWQSGLLSAAYKSSVPDPMDRYHKLLAQGVAYKQADEIYPTTALSQMVESDYALMEQDWSRDFIKTRTRKGVKSQYVDFAGMREYAVEHGLGKWKNEDAGHTADNFELITDALEGIEETSDKVNDSFKGWGDGLKNALGTITAIGSALVKIGSAAITGAIVLTEKSEKGVIDAATTLDKRRAYVGMSALDELSAQVAGQSVGLGKDAVTEEIINLSNSREKYQLLGEGLNALYPSLTGIFDNIMNTDNPMDAYKGILKEVYGAMRGADKDTRAQTLMLLETQGLGSAAKIIGSLLANEGLASKLDYDPTNLFSLKSNAYYGAYERAETTLPDLVQLNASIKTSYAQLYDDFTEAFGKPFKTWWDKVLQDKVIPWFEKFTHYVRRSDTEKTLDDLVQIIESPVGRVERNDLVLRNPNYAWVSDYTPQEKGFVTERFKALLAGDMSIYTTGETTRNRWDDFVKVAETDDSVINNSNGTKAQKKAGLGVRDRVKYAVDRMKETGLSDFLSNKTYESVDSYFLEAMQLYASGTWDTAKFDKYIDSVLNIGTKGETDDLILEKLSEIAENTSDKQTILDNTSFWNAATRLYGQPAADEMRAAVNRM